MKFDLKKPCVNCPFKKDTLQGWLGKTRSTEIVKALTNDSTFACHKTTVESEDGWEREVVDSSRFCAGALILMEKENVISANVITRIVAFWSKELKLEEMTDKDKVFNSFKEFIKYHSK